MAKCATSYPAASSQRVSSNTVRSTPPLSQWNAFTMSTRMASPGSAAGAGIQREFHQRGPEPGRGFVLEHAPAQILEQEAAQHLEVAKRRLGLAGRPPARAAPSTSARARAGWPAQS